MTDEALMCAYRDGDPHAFEVLFLRHRSAFYRYLLRQSSASVAEELSQDCWMKLIGARKSYEVSAKFTTWLYRIGHNRLIDHFRATDRSALASYANEEDLQAVLESVPETAHREPQNQLETGQLARRLARALRDLPASQREAFLLQYEGNLTVEEIATATGVGRETAKSRLRYALATLRRALAEEIP
ncbi:MAG: sigma-70 family RNA polymerase sigma factor [Burkholderiaceae bacterium]